VVGKYLQVSSPSLTFLSHELIVCLSPPVLVAMEVRGPVYFRGTVEGVGDRCRV